MGTHPVAMAGAESSFTGRSVQLSHLPQQLRGGQLLGLPPGSPGAPLFMMSEQNNNHNYNHNVSHASGSASASANAAGNGTNISSGSSSGGGGKDLSRQLSFLTSRQVAEIELEGEEGSGGVPLLPAATSFSFLSGL